MDELTKSYNKVFYSLYKESHKKSMKKYREKQLNAYVDEEHKCCTRCYKIQPISNFGERMDFVRFDGKNQEAKVPYRSCVACRDRDKRRLTKTIPVL